MGWIYTKNQTLPQLIRQRLGDWENPSLEGEDILLRVTYIKSHRVGFHLWKVAQMHYYSQSTGELIKIRQIIALDLLQFQKGYGWGYKEIYETQGPAYYDCPLQLLVGLPAPENCDASQWREKVYIWHREQADSKRRMKTAKVGEKYTLKNSVVPYVTIVSLKPFRGSYKGKNYRIPVKMLGELIPEQSPETVVQV